MVLYLCLEYLAYYHKKLLRFNKGYCIISSPINPTDADIDVISDELVDDLLVHNEIYERLCE